MGILSETYDANKEIQRLKARIVELQKGLRGPGVAVARLKAQRDEARSSVADLEAKVERLKTNNNTKRQKIRRQKAFLRTINEKEVDNEN